MRKKKSQKIEKVRKFILIHMQGQEEIFAESVIDAKIQGQERLAKKGLHYKQDKKDFYEVRE